jgi:phosphoglycolate phosphatase-like HAD superfamily hydrolase
MKPKAIFFDVDGTILPFEGVIDKLQDACRHFKVRVLTKKEILNYTIGYSIVESIPKLIPETKKFINEFSEYYKNIYNKDVRSIKPFYYVKKVFKWVEKSKIKIGIVTTKSRGQAEVTLKYYKLHYDVLIGRDDVKKRKPNPEPIFKACKILKLNPKDSIFVGDHPFDMQAAKSAGCLPVGVLTGWGNRKNLKNAGAKYLIKDLRGLKKIIE